MKQEIELKPGDIIRYKYKGEWEYARWNGDGTRTLLGILITAAVMNPKRIIQGVWKRGVFMPRKILT